MKFLLIQYLRVSKLKFNSFAKDLPTDVLIRTVNYRQLWAMGILDRMRFNEELSQPDKIVEYSKTWYEQSVSMISDVIWRYDVNARGEFSFYISSAVDRILGVARMAPSETALTNIFATSIPMTCQLCRSYFSKRC